MDNFFWILLLGKHHLVLSSQSVQQYHKKVFFLLDVLFQLRFLYRHALSYLHSLPLIYLLIIWLFSFFVLFDLELILRRSWLSCLLIQLHFYLVSILYLLLMVNLYSISLLHIHLVFHNQSFEHKKLLK